MSLSERPKVRPAGMEAFGAYASDSDEEQEEEPQDARPLLALQVRTLLCTDAASICMPLIDLAHRTRTATKRPLRPLYPRR